MPIETHKIVLTGTTPLVFNNIALADPEYGPTKRRNEILGSVSSASKLTDQQNAELQYLEWFGSLYLNDDGQIVFPTYNIVRSMQRAATPFRLGTAITNGVTIKGQVLPLTYEGPDDIRKLYEDDRFRLRKLVNKTPTAAKASMVVSVRPQFPSWSLEFEAAVLTDVINIDDFHKVLLTAGQGQGLGNARRLGFGQFKSE